MGWGKKSSGALLLVVLTGCGGGGLTGPDGTPAERPRSPYVVVLDRPDLQEWSEAEWPHVAACVGLDPKIIHNFPIKVEPDWFWCGPIAAVGCMEYSRIRVTEFYQGRRYYEGVLHHEFIHLALWKRPGAYAPGNDHENPLFIACDNQGFHHADDGSYAFDRDAWVEVR